VIKPQEADSEVIRANVNAWYQSTLSSRLNDKRTGAIICVMQRLHQYDLPGLLIESGIYDVLSLPAIATAEGVIDLPRNRVHPRRIGDILHPEREPVEELERQRAAMGSERFAAQYQQDPVPAGGNIIKAAWLRPTTPRPLPTLAASSSNRSTARTKAAPPRTSRWSSPARVVGKYVYILDVARFRRDYPDMKKTVIGLAVEHQPDTMLVEDQGAGISLIADLRLVNLRGVPNPIGQRPELSKAERLEGISGMIEGGQLLLPPGCAMARRVQGRGPCLPQRPVR
jgi:hypothetical protein